MNQRKLIEVSPNFFRFGRFIAFRHVDGGTDWLPIRGVLGRYLGLGKFSIGWTDKGTFS